MKEETRSVDCPGIKNAELRYSKTEQGRERRGYPPIPAPRRSYHTNAAARM